MNYVQPGKCINKKELENIRETCMGINGTAGGKRADGESPNIPANPYLG